AGALQLVDEDPLFDRRALEAAVLLRPGESPPAAVAQLENELAAVGPLSLVADLTQLIDHRLRHVLLAEGAHLVAPGTLSRSGFVTCGRPIAARSRRWQWLEDLTPRRKETESPPRLVAAQRVEGAWSSRPFLFLCVLA